MTETERNEKLNAIRRDSTATLEEKREREQTVNAFFDSAQSNAAARKEDEAERLNNSLKEKLKEAFIKSGGTEAEFNASYTNLRNQYLQRAALNPNQQEEFDEEGLRSYRVKF